MNAAEIVIREVQGDGGFEMRQLLAVRIRQPREPAKLHSQGKVLPFHKRCTDVIGVGITAADFGYNLRDRSWGVPLISKLAMVTIQFRQLSEISIAREGFLNSLAIKDVRIRGQLHAVSAESVIQIQHEGLRVGAGTFPDEVGRDELRIGIKGHENPLIAKVCRVIFSDLFLLLHQEAPNFITLNATAEQLAHLFVHYFFAALARQKQQPHDCVPVESSEPFSRANRTALKQTLDCASRYVRLRQHRVPRQPVVGFAESGFAGSAAPSLDSALTKVPESLCSTVVTTDARHIGLEFPAGQADNGFAVGIAAHPACRLALAKAATDAGASFWYRDGQTRTGISELSRQALCPFELRPHKRGIHDLQTVNASRSLNQFWWPSHSSSPFDWIEHTKSFFPRFFEHLAEILSVRTGHAASRCGRRRQFDGSDDWCSRTTEGFCQNACNASVLYPAIHVSAIDIAGRLNLPFLMKPFCDGVNRSQEVPPTTGVSHTLHLRSHVMCGHVAPCRSKCHTDCVGQSESIFFHEFRFVAKLCESRNCLSQFNDVALCLGSLFLSYSKRMHAVGQVSLGLLKGLFVSRYIHIG